MKRRLLIMVCVLALLVCGAALAAAAEDTTTQRYTCQHCNAEVDWVPVEFGGHYVATDATETTAATDASNAAETTEASDATDATEGTVEETVSGTPHEEGQTHLHYYLDKDYAASEVKQIVLYSGMTMCLDLKGHTITSHGRLILAKDSTTASVMDSSEEKTGAINAYSSATSNNVAGGVMWVQENSELNIYGGTYTLENAKEEDGTWRTDNGGIIYTSSGAVCNINGGTVTGAEVGGVGGAIYVSPRAQLNVSGDAVITAGIAESMGNCVYAPGEESRVKLSGNANVDEIFYGHDNFDDPNLVISGVYTGAANIRYNTANETVIDDKRVALSDGADISDAILHCTNDPGYYIVEKNDNYLVLSSIPANVVKKECQHCGTEVEWVPAVMGKHLVGEEADTASVFYHDQAEHLHYYLHRDEYTENMVKQFSISSGIELCLDLNGKTINSPGRMFLTSGEGVSINIMDSVGTATVNVTSRPKGNNIYGGVMWVTANSELNIYGGTYNLTNDETQYTTKGGIIYVSGLGTCNLFGGTFNGADVKSYGGAVFIENNGELNVSNDTVITAGTATKGGCVYLAGSSSRVTLSGKASVDELYITYNINNRYCLTVSGEYTGTADMYFDPAYVRLSEGVTKVGVSDGAVIGDNILCTNDNGYYVTVDEGYLVITLFSSTDVAGIITADTKTGYPSLAEAVEAYTGEGYISMLKDTDESVELNKDVSLALNGKKITGTTTVNEGSTLYGMDSKTDDYTVSDKDYGTITVVGEGEVKGYPETTGGYLAITEDGVTSFHKVNLRLTEMTLRPMTDNVCAPSVYYTSDFMADEMVQPLITKFGVALSVIDEPNEGNIETIDTTGMVSTKICHCSSFEGTMFEAGPDGNSVNGTLLTGVMKPTNAELVNRRNANKGVWGRAYVQIKLSDTESVYMFGDSHEMSLKQLTEAADEMWNELTTAQKNGLKEMYNTYKSVVANWNMPNLVEYIGPVLDKDDSAEEEAPTEETTGETTEETTE